MGQEGRSRKVYPADLTDEQWALVGPRIPPAKASPHGGRPRKVDMREVLNPLCSLNRRGCPWERLPQAVLPKRTVSDAFAQWRDDGTWAKMGKALRERPRVEAGHEPTPSAACIASPSVQTTERGGPERGEDGGKHINGRQRHLWVDTLGVLLVVLMTSAGLEDGVAAPIRLGHVQAHALPRLVTICADTQSHHHALEAWMAAPRTGWHRAVQTRPEGTTGFTPLEKRWVVERTHAWHGRSRRHSKDDERSVESRTAMLQISHMNLMLNRLAHGGRPAFHYRKDAA